MFELLVQEEEESRDHHEKARGKAEYLGLDQLRRVTRRSIYANLYKLFNSLAIEASFYSAVSVADVWNYAWVSKNRLACLVCSWLRRKRIVSLY